MKFHYDKSIDQLAISFSERPSASSEEIAPGFVVDLDDMGRVVGIEIEHASQSVNLDQLDVGDLPIAELTLRRV